MKATSFTLGAALMLGAGPFAFAKLAPEQIAKLPPPATRPVDFSKEVKPILEASCVKCHGRGKAKGGFKLDTRESFLQPADSGPTVVVGKSAESYLIELVAGFDPDSVMPKKGSRLKPDQISVLRAWIDQGLKWDEAVTFAKPAPKNLVPRPIALPPATRASGSHPVDRLLTGYFAAHQVKLARVVEDRVFARRVYLDLIGLLPTPTELDRFLTDKRPDKREQLVDALLNDNQRFAAHWLSFWNDLLRNDYRGTGYIDGGREQITGWLYSSLATNTPYDRFVAQLIDPVPGAKGFVKGIVWRGAVNASQTPQMQAAQNIAQVFLGVNLKCASCHDSFINDWALADAYGMASVYADGALEMFQCDKPTGKKVGARFMYPELGEIRADAPQAEKQKRLAEILTSRLNGRLTRTIVNRLWARFLGHGLVEPVDDMEQTAWHQDLLDWLADDLAASGYDLKRTMKLIVTSRAYQLPSVGLDEPRPGDFVFAGPMVRRLSAEQYRDALAALTGIWQTAPAATFDFSAGLAERDASTAALRSAKWIWSHTNAAQRALAERIYFRKTFTLSAAPEEATAVVACDNSYKLFVNGAPVLSGKDHNAPNFADLRPHLKAGRNVLAALAINHTPNNQLPAEDQPPVEADANPAGFVFFAQIRTGGGTQIIASDATWTWSKEKKTGWEKTDFDAENWRPAAELVGATMPPWDLGPKLMQAYSLALVHGQFRASQVAADPLAVALGRPAREQVATTRPSAATTLQALELTNGETLSKLLERGAEKLLAQTPAANTELVTRLYRQALGRAPAPAELKLAGELLGQPARKEGLEDLLWAMSSLPEFQLIY